MTLFLILPSPVYCK